MRPSRSVGVQYAPGEEWRSSWRRNVEAGPGLERHPAVDVPSGKSQVWCRKEQYCIGTWAVRSVNQGKSNVAKQDMAIIGISEIKWMGMGIFNSDDHYIYYWGRRWRSSTQSAKKKKRKKEKTQS